MIGARIIVRLKKTRPTVTKLHHENTVLGLE